SDSASRTSSSLNGLMIAMIIFITRPPLAVRAGYRGPGGGRAFPIYRHASGRWRGTGAAAKLPPSPEDTHDRPRPYRRPRPPPQQPGAPGPARRPRGAAGELQVRAPGRPGAAGPGDAGGVRRA